MTAGRTNSGALSQHWCTPPKYVEAVKHFFGGEVALDPCSNEFSIVGADLEYALPAVDGLAASWDYSTIFVNPPYGRDKVRRTSISDWLCKCHDAHQVYGSEVLALIPVATNTRHWKRYVFGQAAGIAFLYDTRLRFLVNGEAQGTGAPMSCAMVYWGLDYERFEHIFLQYGAVVDIRRLQDRAIGGSRQISLSASSGDVRWI